MHRFVILAIVLQFLCHEFRLFSNMRDWSGFGHFNFERSSVRKDWTFYFTLHRNRRIARVFISVLDYSNKKTLAYRWSDCVVTWLIQKFSHMRCFIASRQYYPTNSYAYFSIRMRKRQRARVNNHRRSNKAECTTSTNHSHSSRSIAWYLVVVIEQRHSRVRYTIAANDKIHHIHMKTYPHT